VLWHAKIGKIVFSGKKESLGRDAWVKLVSDSVFGKRALPYPQRKSENTRAVIVSALCTSY
jgi:hypothetical protein